MRSIETLLFATVLIVAYVMRAALCINNLNYVLRYTPFETSNPNGKTTRLNTYVYTDGTAQPQVNPQRPLSLPVSQPASLQKSESPKRKALAVSVRKEETVYRPSVQPTRVAVHPIYPVVCYPFELDSGISFLLRSPVFLRNEEV